MNIDLTGLNKANYSDLVTMVQGSINLIISISALLAVIVLVKAGFEYILSAGDGDKAEKAQKTIIYTLVGLIFVFISPLVIRFVLESVL